MGVRPGRLAGATHCSGRPVWLASAPPPCSLPQPCPVPLPRFCCDYPGLGCLHMRQRFPPSPQRLLCCSMSRGVRPFSGASGNCSEAVSLIPVQPWVTLLWPSPLGRWLCGAPTWTVRWSTALTAPCPTPCPCSRDPHRGVHTHTSLPCAAVSRVRGRGGRGLEGRAAHGRLPHRGEAALTWQAGVWASGP